MDKIKKFKKIIIVFSVLVIIFSLMGGQALAEPNVSITGDGITLGTTNNPKEVSSSIQLLLLLTILSVLPSVLIMMTSFTRTIIILSFLRNALGTQQMPPNQVMIGLALFLTFFIMNPVLMDINDNALQPYVREEIKSTEAIDKSSQIIKNWMIKQIFSNGREKDLELFMTLGGQKDPIKVEDAAKLKLSIVAPAFLISELTIAFKFGFLIFLPFLVIDMVVASSLMSMGMMMLPPVMISLPFKILLFVLVDGWSMLSQAIVSSFAG